MRSLGTRRQQTLLQGPKERDAAEVREVHTKAGTGKGVGSVWAGLTGPEGDDPSILGAGNAPLVPTKGQNPSDLRRAALFLRVLPGYKAANGVGTAAPITPGARLGGGDASACV